MSSVAVLLQENVIEELNLSYLVRRRKKTPPKEDDVQEENQQDDDEEVQTTKEENASEESVESKSDEEDKEGGEAEQGSDTGDQELANEEKDDEQPSERDKTNDAINDDQKEEEAQQVRNTSLKVLSMAGNFLDDDYLESLMNIFPAQTHQYTSPSKDESSCSHLEELTLLGNRFSKHGIKELLKTLPRFPYLQRLYLGYQRAPPPQRPTGLPPAILARMMASSPSLSDRTTQFNPSSLKKEFVAAVSENPRNFRLTEVNVMALTNEDKEVEELLRHHMMLNAAGRKLLASNVKPNDTAFGTEDKSQSTVPLGLWPFVLDRANRLFPLSSSSGDIEGNQDCEDDLIALLDATDPRNEPKVDCDRFHAADVIFCLLHGPMVFENLDRRPLQS